jgi:hypothetical protein
LENPVKQLVWLLMLAQVVSAMNLADLFGDYEYDNLASQATPTAANLKHEKQDLKCNFMHFALFCFYFNVNFSSFFVDNLKIKNDQENEDEEENDADERALDNEDFEEAKYLGGEVHQRDEHKQTLDNDVSDNSKSEIDQGDPSKEQVKGEEEVGDRQENTGSKKAKKMGFAKDTPAPLPVQPKAGSTPRPKNMKSAKQQKGLKGQNGPSKKPLRQMVNAKPPGARMLRDFHARALHEKEKRMKRAKKSVKARKSVRGQINPQEEPVNHGQDEGDDADELEHLEEAEQLAEASRAQQEKNGTEGSGQGLNLLSRMMSASSLGPEMKPVQIWRVMKPRDEIVKFVMGSERVEQEPKGEDYNDDADDKEQTFYTEEDIAEENLDSNKDLQEDNQTQTYNDDDDYDDDDEEEEEEETGKDDEEEEEGESEEEEKLVDSVEEGGWPNAQRAVEAFNRENGEEGRERGREDEWEGEEDGGEGVQAVEQQENPEHDKKSADDREKSEEDDGEKYVTKNGQKPKRKGRKSRDESDQDGKNEPLEEEDDRKETSSSSGES